jgi:hypothetical protein
MPGNATDTIDTIRKLTFNLKPAQLAEEEQRKMREAVAKARD